MASSKKGKLMLRLIFELGMWSIVLLFYLLIRKYYIKEQFILEDKGSNRKIRVFGNYIKISCDGENALISKDAENKWYFQLNDEEEKGLKYEELIKVGNKEFKFAKREKKGGFFVLLPLIITALTIWILFQQSYAIMSNNEESALEREENDLMDIAMQDEIEEGDSNILLDDEKLKEKDEDISLIDNKDIHSIVLENDQLFQNSMSIDWEAYQNDENMRRSLLNNPSEMGISVSKFQKEIDWQKVKQDGIDFAIIQVGSRGYETGNLREDDYFKDNMDGAARNNVKAGVCFYSQAVSKEEMDEEIEMILQAVKKYTLDYPIGIALERAEHCRTINLSDEEYIDLIKYFCIKIKQNGYVPMIMGNEEWFRQFSDEVFDGYFKLVYSANTAPSNIDNCIIWQYRQNTKGIVDGVGRKLVLSINLSAYVHEEEDKND